MTCLLTDWDKISHLYRGTSINASYQVSVHLAKQFQRRRFFFRNQPIRNKNCLWRPCLLTDQNGMSNSHRGPSTDASYQVSVYLTKLCRSRRFLEIDQSEKKNCLWRPCLLANPAEMSHLYSGPSTNASYQVSVHLPKRFQRRFFRNQPISKIIACGGHLC